MKLINSVDFNALSTGNRNVNYLGYFIDYQHMLILIFLKAYFLILFNIVEYFQYSSYKTIVDFFFTNHIIYNDNSKYI